MANQQYNIITTGIGTHWDISYFGSGDFSVYAQADIEQMITYFEQRFSRFKSDSLVSKLNHDRIIITDDVDFHEMVRLGIYYSAISDGYFSLLVGSTLENLGYDATYSFELRDTQGFEMSEIIVEGDTISLTGNQCIDLGGIGKGYLIRMIQHYFIDHGIVCYCINGGGDIVISHENNEFGSISIQHPLDHDSIIGSVVVAHGASATSGISHRKWGSYHHLINPHTDLPSTNPLLSISIVHDDIVVADVAATMLFVLPIEQIHHTASLLGVEYMLIFDDCTSMRSAGFPLQEIDV